MAFAGLLAAALLGTHFDRRAVLVVMAFTVLPDLDSFIALVSVAGHRTVLHTYLLPVGLGVLLAADTQLRESSFVRDRWGQWGVAVGWVSLLCMAVAGIGLDFIEAGVNPLWPLHDQFYALNGKVELSDERGLIQTFVEVEFGGDGASSGGTPSGESSDGGSTVPSVEPEAIGSSQEVNMSTGVDPDPDGSQEDPERVFPVARAGWQLLLLVTGFAVTAVRLWRAED